MEYAHTTIIKFDFLKKIFYDFPNSTYQQGNTHMQLSSKIKLRILSRYDHFANFKLYTSIINISAFQQGLCTLCIAHTPIKKFGFLKNIFSDFQKGTTTRLKYIKINNSTAKIPLHIEKGGDYKFKKK